MVETGLDYRNIKQRSQETGDLNSCNWNTLDPLYSDAFNRQSMFCCANQSLNNANLRMNSKVVPAKDTQLFKAKCKMDEICRQLMLGKSISAKAHVLFCKFVRTMGKLPREEDMIAACLFYALPDEPVAYKRKKRKLTPWNDSKKKKLKRMNLKEPTERVRRQYSTKRK